MDYIHSIERLGRAMETRAMDESIINQLNDVHDEAVRVDQYIGELEWQNYHSVQRMIRTIEFLAGCNRLRVGIVRNIKQMRRHQGIRSVLEKVK